MRILNIYNNVPFYRQGIFTLMDREFDCDWIFGEALGDIKQMELSKLRGKAKVVKNVSLLGGRAYWQKGVLLQVFNKYTHYIFLGEERCISTWFFLLLALFFPKKKVFFWSHGPYGKEGQIKRMIQKVFYNLVDGTFLYGNYARDVMIKRGFDPKNLHIIHNSLNYDRQLELRNSGLQSDIYKDHFGNDNHVLLFIGRLTKVKQLDRIIDAMALLKEKEDKYNLVFVGDGVERDNLLKKVNDNDLKNNVWFYGACYDENENAKLIYNADLCVAPGNVGLTAMHSLVFGTPVITHNNFAWQMPEFEAIVSGKTGDYFEYENNESLAKCISQWFVDENYNREANRQSCFTQIDENWTPKFQINVLNNNL